MDAADGAAVAAEGTTDTGTSDGAGAPDLSPLMERVDGLASTFENRFSAVEQSLQGLMGPEDDAGDDEFDLASLFTQEGEQQSDPAGQLNPQALQALVDQRMEAMLTDRLGPIGQQVQGMQVELGAERLTAKYPDLANPEVAEAVAGRAQELAQSLGQPGLVTNMQFLETIYQAQMAQKYAAGEVPVGEQQHELERAGGAGPSAGPEPNIAERIVANRGDGQFWTNWK